jgi:hypothetical protein
MSLPQNHLRAAVNHYNSLLGQAPFDENEKHQKIFVALLEQLKKAKNTKEVLETKDKIKEHINKTRQESSAYITSNPQLSDKEKNKQEQEKNEALNSTLFHIAHYLQNTYMSQTMIGAASRDSSNSSSGEIQGVMDGTEDSYALSEISKDLETANTLNPSDVKEKGVTVRGDGSLESKDLAALVREGYRHGKNNLHLSGVDLKEPSHLDEVNAALDEAIRLEHPVNITGVDFSKKPMISSKFSPFKWAKLERNLAINKAMLAAKASYPNDREKRILETYKLLKNQGEDSAAQAYLEGVIKEGKKFPDNINRLGHLLNEAILFYHDEKGIFDDFHETLKTAGSSFGIENKDYGALIIEADTSLGRSLVLQVINTQTLINALPEGDEKNKLQGRLDDLKANLGLDSKDLEELQGYQEEDYRSLIHLLDRENNPVQTMKDLETLEGEVNEKFIQAKVKPQNNPVPPQNSLVEAGFSKWVNLENDKLKKRALENLNEQIDTQESIGDPDITIKFLGADLTPQQAQELRERVTAAMNDLIMNGNLDDQPEPGNEPPAHLQIFSNWKNLGEQNQIELHDELDELIKDAEENGSDTVTFQNQTLNLNVAKELEYGMQNYFNPEEEEDEDLLEFNPNPAPAPQYEVQEEEEEEYYQAYNTWKDLDEEEQANALSQLEENIADALNIDNLEQDTVNFLGKEISFATAMTLRDNIKNEIPDGGFNFDASQEERKEEEEVHQRRMDNLQ